MLNKKTKLEWLRVTLAAAPGIGIVLFLIIIVANFAHQLFQ